MLHYRLMNLVILFMLTQYKLQSNYNTIKMKNDVQTKHVQIAIVY